MRVSEPEVDRFGRFAQRDAGEWRAGCWDVGEEGFVFVAEVVVFWGLRR